VDAVDRLRFRVGDVDGTPLGHLHVVQETGVRDLEVQDRASGLQVNADDAVQVGDVEDIAGDVHAFRRVELGADRGGGVGARVDLLAVSGDRGDEAVAVLVRRAAPDVRHQETVAAGVECHARRAIEPVHLEDEIAM